MFFRWRWTELVIIAPLHRWNIPEAVTGGFLAAIVTLLAYTRFGTEINFSLGARDLLLLYFFTGIGLNARLDDLAFGGRACLLLGLTLVYLVIQNLIAAGSVVALGLPKGITPSSVQHRSSAGMARRLPGRLSSPSASGSPMRSKSV